MQAVSGRSAKVQQHLSWLKEGTDDSTKKVKKEVVVADDCANGTGVELRRMRRVKGMPTLLPGQLLFVASTSSGMLASILMHTHPVLF